MTRPPSPPASIFPRLGRLAEELVRRARGVDQRILYSLAGGSGDRPGLGQGLYGAYRPYREAIDACAAVAEEVLGPSAASLFQGADAAGGTGVTAARNSIIRLGMVQIAEVDLWREAGLHPAGVVAVSLGEMVAPYAAGAFTREECARVVAVVAHAISRTPSRERIFFLACEPVDARRLARGAPAPLEYLGSIRPGLVSIIGREDDADAVRPFLAARLVREMPSSWCYHTPRLDVDRAWMEEQLRPLKPRPAARTIYSAAAGGALPPETVFDAGFFAWMVSRPFHFSAAARAALDDGYDAVICVGARPTVGDAMQDVARAEGRTPRFIHPAPGDEVRGWRRARSAARGLRAVPAQAHAPADPRTLDLARPGTGRRIFQVYEELRSAGPVHYLERHGRWLLLGYDDVSRALADARRFSSRAPTLEAVDPYLLANDPPEHTAVRRIIGRCFSAADTERRARAAERLAESLLRPLADGCELEVVEGFARPLATALGADLAGLDEETAATLADAAHSAMGSTARLFPLLEGPLDAVVHRSALYQWFRTGAGGSMDDRAARSLVRMLWVAGTETLPRAVSSAVWMLLRHPELRGPIAADAGLLAPFVDEVLRLLPPEHLVPRRTTEAVRVGDRTIPADAVVELCLAAANRDPARFPDPASLRLDRGPAAHLSFAGGPHRCIGAAMARAHTGAAIAALLRAAPRFRAVQPLGTVRYLRFAPHRAIQELVIGR
ncbi:MAG TPA: cytochrome P450 [Longimicrobium sp.]